MDALLREEALSPVEAAPLRVVIAGSVDDGKSTLTGRFLHDAGLLTDDQAEALRRTAGTGAGTGEGGPEPDFASLTDGLTDEREQGITIDVAYRYFDLHGRRIILADVPGHEQYTRNMVTAASDGDALVLLVDAERGPTRQTWRHLSLAFLLRVGTVVVAVNKMDRIGYDETAFAGIRDRIAAHAALFGYEGTHVLPVSALRGDNIVARSEAMGWYDGPALFEFLTRLPAGASAAGIYAGIEAGADAGAPLHLPVRYVSRPSATSGRATGRAYLGRIARGRIAEGDNVTVLPSGRSATVRRLVALGDEVPQAVAGQSVSVQLDRDIDIARGDVLSAADAPAATAAAAIDAALFWFGREPLDPAGRYILKTQTAGVRARIRSVTGFVDVETPRVEAAADRPVAENDIVLAGLVTETPVAFATYRKSRKAGSFILIDETTHETVAAGLFGSDIVPAGI